MNHRWATMTAAKGGIGLLQLFNHFAHFAHRQEVIGLNSGFASDVRQGMLFPGLTMASLLWYSQIHQQFMERASIHLLNQHLRHGFDVEQIVFKNVEAKSNLF